MFGCKRVCLFACACTMLLFVCAQDSTRVLDDVQVIGIDLSRFSSGTNLTMMEREPGGSLAAIEDQTSIYFKNYGSQQLSTISLRGTTSSQTSVIWNGIPVNSPTLGQTDFSIWPMFLTDQILLQKGGGSSLFGSGAIGGSVIIDNSRFRQDSLITIYSSLGSFGEVNGGLGLRLGNERWSNDLRIFASQIQNDFPVEGGGRQEHASVGRKAFSNKLGYRYKNGRLFSELAYAENDRNIQPTRTSASRSTLKSKNLRTVVNNVINGRGKHHSTLGLIKDETIFNDSSVTSSQRFMGSHSFENSVGNNVFLRVGGSAFYEWADSDNFQGTESQTQGHLFASGTFFGRKGSVTVNLRQAFFEGNAVFVPSLGIESAVSQRNDVQVKLRAQVSRDYRIPTFNDLYWQPGGNRNLTPEVSRNFESGMDLKVSTFKFISTAFVSRIDEMIQWEPLDGIWSPRNIRSVQTWGWEATASNDFDFEWSRLVLGLDYTYTRSSDRDGKEGNQLPYVPKHSASGRANLQVQNTSIGLTANYTGERFTTISNSRNNRINDFLLLGSSISQRVDLQSLHVNLNFRIRNIANVDYENLLNTAMPGRSFLIELTTKI